MFAWSWTNAVAPIFLLYLGPPGAVIFSKQQWLKYATLHISVTLTQCD